MIKSYIKLHRTTEAMFVDQDERFYFVSAKNWDDLLCDEDLFDIAKTPVVVIMECAGRVVARAFDKRDLTSKGLRKVIERFVNTAIKRLNLKKNSSNYGLRAI